jgi:hypothetical protein
MAAHMDKVFEVVDGQAIVEQYIPYDEPEICVDGDSYYMEEGAREMAPWDSEEFKDCADGWYWQHRRIRPGEDSLGQPMGPLSGPFVTKGAAKESQRANTAIYGATRL